MSTIATFYIEKYIKKGDFVVISGYLTTTAFTDKSGQERKTYGIKVVSIEANGNTNADPVVARVTILNGLDGKWTLLANGQTIADGTSEIDPTSSPKTIELKSRRSSVDNARGTNYRGIYEVHETTRRICFVPADKPLPESFDGGLETGQILVTFERVMFE